MTDHQKSDDIPKTYSDDEIWRIAIYEPKKLAAFTENMSKRLKLLAEKRNTEMAEGSERLRLEDRPVVEALRKVGICVEELWDLDRRRWPYPAAISVLLEHLQLPYSDKLRAGIARALVLPAPEVRRAWPILVEQYIKTPSGWGIQGPGDTKKFQLLAKYYLANVLVASVTDETIPELISLLKDRRNGTSRVLLLSALRKRRSKNALAQQAILDLREDTDLASEIAAWKPLSPISSDRSTAGRDQKGSVEKTTV